MLLFFAAAAKCNNLFCDNSVKFSNLIFFLIFSVLSILFFQLMNVRYYYSFKNKTLLS